MVDGLVSCAVIIYHPNPENGQIMKTVTDDGKSVVVTGHFNETICDQIETIYDVADTLVKGGGFITARPDLSEFNADYEANYEMLIQLQPDNTCTTYIQNGELSIIVPCGLSGAQFRNLCRELLTHGVL